MTDKNLTVYYNEHLNHTVDKSNPHGVNKEQVDLGNVENYGVASVEEAMEGLVENKYMTPALVKQAIESYLNNGVVRIRTGVELIHQTISVIIDQENQKEIIVPMQDFNQELHPFELRVGGVPFYHERYSIVDGKVVLKEGEVGLALGKRVDFVFCYLEQVGNINLPINGVNIRTGSITREKLSPEYRDFIDSRADAVHTHTKADITDLVLEHTHTKAEIGLGNVSNYGIASTEEAQLGAVNNKYMTPLRSMEQLEGKGLGGTCKNISGSDLNTLLDLGFYMGSSLTNSPTGVRDATHWFFITVMKHNDSYAVQTATGYGNELNSKVMYHRVYNNGLWSEWETLVTKSYVDGVVESLTSRIEALENKGAE